MLIPNGKAKIVDFRHSFQVEITEIQLVGRRVCLIVRC